MIFTGTSFLAIIFFGVGLLLSKKNLTLGESIFASIICVCLFAFAIIYDYLSRNSGIADNIIVAELIMLSITLPLGIFTGRWFKRKICN